VTIDIRMLLLLARAPVSHTRRRFVVNLYAVEKWDQSATGRTRVSRYVGISLRAVARNVESRSDGLGL
jgi:hypothetical protein